MDTTTFEILDSLEIQSFSVKVTEKINDKYLLDFLRTAIINEQLEINKKSYFYYSFILSVLSYEILVFNAPNKNSIPEPFILQEKATAHTLELFITKNYFCLFNDKNLLLYKDIDNIFQEDIRKYIEQLYKIKVNKVTIIDENKYHSIKDNFITNSKKYSFDFYTVTKEKSFTLFLVFLFVTMTIFSTVLLIHYNNTISTQYKNIYIPQYEKGYKKLLRLYKSTNKNPINISISFFKYIKNNSITIENIRYKNSKLYTTLIDTHRKKLLQVVSNYTRNIEVQSIQFNKNKQNYEMDIIIDVKK